MDKIYVTRSSMPSYEEYIEEIKSLWDTHILTNMGEKHKLLEKQLKEYLEVDNLSLMVNGHMALELALQAFDLHGEVITTPFTFASTTHAIVRNGLTPVFCDIEPDHFTIDANKIEDLITEKTCAIVPVHVYGNICDVEKIQEIAEKYHLKVIYDGAHAFGEKYKGIGIGNFGDATMFSFHATKVFNTIEGGAVSFHDDQYGKDLYGLKNFGIRGPEIVNFVGANAKMNEFQAAMGLCNLRHVDEEINKRKNIYHLYVEMLKDVPGIRLMKLRDNIEFNYAYFPIIVDEKEYGMNRNQLFDKLAENNIFVRKYFYPLTSEYECYSGILSLDKTPNAKWISERVLALPMYAELQVKQVQLICDIIKK